MATVANITAAVVDARLRHTVVGFGLLLAVVVALASVEAPAWAHALLFLPALFVSMIAYQALFKTCAYMASKGMRDLGDGAEKCACPRMTAELRARARHIAMFSLGTAGALTGLAMLAVGVR